jgi:polygalacturonase
MLPLLFLAGLAVAEVTVNVVDHGAVGDGITSNTAAFVSAVKAVADGGGGTLIVRTG